MWGEWIEMRHDVALKRRKNHSALIPELWIQFGRIVNVTHLMLVNEQDDGPPEKKEWRCCCWQCTPGLLCVCQRQYKTQGKLDRKRGRWDKDLSNSTGHLNISTQLPTTQHHSQFSYLGSTILNRRVDQECVSVVDGCFCQTNFNYDISEQVGIDDRLLHGMSRCLNQWSSSPSHSPSSSLFITVPMCVDGDEQCKQKTDI